MTVDLDDLEDQPSPTDFRRANGAPLVRSLDDKKWDRYSRPSTWGDALDEKSALTNWRIDRAIEGVAATPSLSASIAANVGRKEGRKDRREQAISIGRGEEAADLGTALHAMAHRVETEPGFGAPEPYASDLAAYLRAVDEAGLESTHFECHLCADIWRAAGTADRIYKANRELHLPDGSVLEPGQSVIGDLKTGKKLDYSLPGFCIQLAIYADGCFYDVATDVRSPLPDAFHTGWGVLVHLPVGQAEATLWWLDLEVGRIGARLVQQVRAWRKRDDFSGPFVFPPSDEIAVLSSPIYDLEHGAPDGDHLDHPDDDAWREEMLPWAQDRIRAIGRHSEARAMLLRRWPAPIPPLTQGGLSTQQLSQILDLLDVIESAYSLPFCEGDPRVEWNRGLHSDEGIHGNEPRSMKQ